MRSSHIGRVSLFTLLVSLAMICGAVVGYAQAPKVPPSGPRTPAPAAPAKPAPRKPADPAPAAAPKPAPAADVRFKSKYTTGDQVTESVTYLKNNRERYELADMILLKQHDQNRVVQISRSAKTYLVSPDGVPAIASMVDQAAAQKAPGVVLVATSIVDTGERKTAFGLPARHIKTIIERQPQPGACDQSRQRIETDAWYIDAPKSAAGQDNTDGASSSTSSHDEVKTTQNGDPKVLGFPISYNTTFLDADGKPMVVAMEVTEFEITSLESLNSALSELGEYHRRVVFPSQLCSMPNYLGDVEYNAANERFAILVGDTPGASSEFIFSIVATGDSTCARTPRQTIRSKG